MIFAPGAIVAADSVNLLYCGDTDGRPRRDHSVVILLQSDRGRNPLAEFIRVVFLLGSPEGYNSDQSGTVRGKCFCPHYDPTKHKAQFGFDKGHS